MHASHIVRGERSLVRAGAKKKHSRLSSTQTEIESAYITKPLAAYLFADLVTDLVASSGKAGEVVLHLFPEQIQIKNGMGRHFDLEILYEH
jgi:hypothetical protein